MNKRYILALMVLLPVVTASMVGGAMCSEVNEMKYMLAAMAMFALAAMQLFIGMLFFGPKNLLNERPSHQTENTLSGAH